MPLGTQSIFAGGRRGFAAGCRRWITPPTAGAYHVSNVLHIGGAGRWDYVTIDPQTQTLYVPRQTHTQIIKAATGEVVADLADTMRRSWGGSNGYDLPSRICQQWHEQFRHRFRSHHQQGTRHDSRRQKAGCDHLRPGFAESAGILWKERGCDRDRPRRGTRPSQGRGASPWRARPEFAASDGAGHVYVNLEDKDSSRRDRHHGDEGDRGLENRRRRRAHRTGHRRRPSPGCSAAAPTR